MKNIRSWTPGILVFSLLGFYQIFYVFNFFPITEGWFSTYAWLIRTGEIPYRDFPLLMPPFYPLEIAFIQTIFGESIFTLRVIGAFIVSGIGLSLWFILTRFFNPWVSAFSSTIACIYYQMGNAFISYDFTQFLTLNLLLGSGLMLVSVKSLSARCEKVSFFSASFLSGLFLGIAALTKQSNAGFFILVLTFGFAVILFRAYPLRQAVKNAVQYASGGLIVLILILIWLGVNNAIKSFYYQVVFDALQSKGGSGVIFTGWVKGFFGDPSYFLRSFQITKNLLGLLIWTAAPIAGTLVLAINPYYPLNKIIDYRLFPFSGICFSKIRFQVIISFSCFVVLFAAWISSPLQDVSSQNAHQFTIAILVQILKFCIWSFLPGLLFIFIYKKFIFQHGNNLSLILKKWISTSYFFVSIVGFIGLIGLITLSYFASQYINPVWLTEGSYIGGNLIVFSTNLYVIGSVILFFAFIYKPTNQKALLWILFLIGLGLTLGNGTSAGLSEISAFYGLSIFIAALFSLGAPFIFPIFLPLLMSLQFSSFLIETKINQPYAWWSVKSTNIRTLSCAKTSGILKRLCIDPDKYGKIVRIVRRIESVSNKNDQLYVFPHLPIFNLLSERKPYQNAVVSWFDFTSKNQVKNIASSLLKEPPQVLLVARLPLEIFEGHERLFNNSEPSEQRIIVSAIDNLVSQGKVRMIDSDTIDGIKIELYQRVN